MSTTTTDDWKQFSVETQWLIKNLTTETGKKFNGKTCVVVSTFDASTGRVGVRIKNATNRGRTLNIKPINLHDDPSTTQMKELEETPKPQEVENVKDCPQEAEDKEDCPICTDALPRLSEQFTRLSCCGKGLHHKCARDLMENKSMTQQQKMTCIMCRTKLVTKGSKEDTDRFRGWVKKGKAWAMSILAERYRKGVGVKRSDKKAIELFEMAAKRGHASAQYNLGLFYDQGTNGLTQSSKRAIKFFTLAAEQGHATAQCILGTMYANGDGIEQSDKKAIELFEMAAKRGNASAQFNLGLYYDQGSHGLTQSSKRAIEFYTLAAEQGHATAQCNLGIMYITGEGIEQSNSKAREWWTKAAAQGDEQAINNLKIMDERERLSSSTTPPPEVVDASIISCSTCGKQQTKEFRLGKCACRTKRYCNSQCQKKQYKQHKKECLRLVKEQKKKSLKEDGTTDDRKEMPKQEAEDVEDCPICCDALPKISGQFTRLTCCGKGLHHKCDKDLSATMSMTFEQKSTCIMCRTKDVANGSKEDIERLRGWMKKEKAWAMSMLSQRYLKGVGVKQSDKKAIELLEMAAQRGDASAQYNLGYYYEKGKRGVTQSFENAIALYTLAAEQGLPEAQCNLGLLYARAGHFSKAREWFTKAAAQKYEGANKYLEMLDEQELLQSTTTAPPEVVDPKILSCSTCGKPETNEFKLKKCACYTTWYCDTACQKKHRKQHKKECLRLVKERKKKKNGQKMKDGTKDDKKEKPIQEEDDKEDCPICTDALPKLSTQFTRYTCCGKGMHKKCAKDLRENTSMTREQKNTCIMCRTKAVKSGSKEEIERIREWVKKGKAWAFELLGQRYRKGLGVKQSDKKTIELYEMAAKRGNANAQYNLGVYYDQGISGLTQSPERAFEFYTLAANQGHLDAQCNLGAMYANGDGIEQSSQRAIEYYTLSAEQGQATAQYNLGRMYAEGEGIGQSYSKAREWWTKAAAQGYEDAIKGLKQLDELGL